MTLATPEAFGEARALHPCEAGDEYHGGAPHSQALGQQIAAGGVKKIQVDYQMTRIKPAEETLSV